MDNLDFNYTLLIQLANFLITLVVLNFLLIKPIREQIKQRKGLTDGFLNDISVFTSLAEEKLASYASELDKARQEAAATRDTQKNEGRSSEQAILQNAQQQAQQYLKESREKISAQVHAVEAELSGKIPAYAELVVSKILG